MPSRSKRRQKTSAWQRLDRREIKIMQMIEGWRPAKGVFTITWSQQNTVIDAVAETHAEFARAWIDRLRRQPHSVESFQTEIHRIREEVPELAVQLWESVTAGLRFFCAPSVDGEEPIFAGLTLPFAVDSSDLSKDYSAITKFVVKERTSERVEPIARAALIRNLKNWSRIDIVHVMQAVARELYGGAGDEGDAVATYAVPAQAPTMTQAAKTLDRTERRGRRGNPTRHRDIATIALRYGEKWPDHLQDVCTDIDAAKIAPRDTPNWKKTWLATLDQPRGPDLIKKAIQASVNSAKKP
jgi:hypothetical protein